MTKNLKCPICKTKEVFFYVKSVDFQNSDDTKDYFAYKCNSCNTIFQYPFPLKEDFDKIYLDNYYAHVENDKIPFSMKLLDFFLKYPFFAAIGKPLIKKMYPYFYIIKESKNILDIGCGKGTFLNMLQKHKKNTYGVDLDSNAVEILKKHGHKATKGDIFDANFENASFDTITLFSVFEHIDNPIDLIEELYRILKPSGHLIMVTPNSSSKLSIQNKNLWVGFDLPRHVILYSSQSINILFNENKFQKKIFIRVSPRDILVTNSLKNKFGESKEIKNKISIYINIIYSFIFNQKVGSLLTIIAKKK